MIILVSPESTPDKPRNVKAIVQSPTSLLITWDPVSAKNGEVPMGYSVHYANVESKFMIILILLADSNVNLSPTIF